MIWAIIAIVGMFGVFAFFVVWGGMLEKVASHERAEIAPPRQAPPAPSHSRSVPASSGLSDADDPRASRPVDTFDMRPRGDESTGGSRNGASRRSPDLAGRFEVLEASPRPVAYHGGEQLETIPRGTYASEVSARLKIESIRQEYLLAGNFRRRWLFVRDNHTGRVVWVVDGVLDGVLESVLDGAGLGSQRQRQRV